MTEVTRELAALVAVVSLAELAIVVSIIHHAWKRFAASLSSLSPELRRATFAASLYLLWPFAVLLLTAFFAIHDQNPADAPALMILSVFAVAIVLAVVTTFIAIRRRVKKLPPVKPDTYALGYSAALFYLAYSVLFDLLALLGVSSYMLMIQTGPFGPDNFQWAKWSLFISIFAFIVGLPVLGVVMAIDDTRKSRKDANQPEQAASPDGRPDHPDVPSPHPSQPHSPQSPRSPAFALRRPVRCIDCGFLGYTEGGSDPTGNYLSGKFYECHLDTRSSPHLLANYLVYSDEGDSWNVIGCFHRVWMLWGTHSKPEQDQARAILTQTRSCRYFFPYQSGYEPAAHNQIKQDLASRRTRLLVALISAAAVLLAALAAIFFRSRALP